MSLTLSISPHGRLLVQNLPATESDEQASFGASEPRIERAFAQGEAAGLLHLATTELQSPLPSSFSFAREIGRSYLTRLCHTPAAEVAEATARAAPQPIAPPPAQELEAMVLRAPPLKGLEYLTAEVLANWWNELDAHVRAQIATFNGSAQAFLRDPQSIVANGRACHIPSGREQTGSFISVRLHGHLFQRALGPGPESSICRFAMRYRNMPVRRTKTR